MPVGRIFLRLVDLLPLPSLRVQRLVAAAVILTQAGISVTGSIVRVTSSGLGCPTWPQCFPGSFTPVPHPEVPGIHQAVEFGNRLITFLVVITAILAVLAVTAVLVGTGGDQGQLYTVEPEALMRNIGPIEAYRPGDAVPVL